jgi:hypothetical protein
MSVKDVLSSRKAAKQNSQQEGEQNPIAIVCAEALASVKDRRENGGAYEKIREKTLILIELVLADLDS